jgi:hypothetical protein
MAAKIPIPIFSCFRINLENREIERTELVDGKS